VVEGIENISTVLKREGYNGFPIINSKGRLVGIINRNTIITMI
jgi:CBS domain-containing protein